MPLSGFTFELDDAQHQKAHIQTLLSKDLMMVTGKGGTGKTMLALAFAQVAAGLGKKVLLVESHYMGKFKSLWPKMGQDVPKLEMLNLSYAQTFQDFVNSEFEKKPLVRKLFQADFLRKFLSSIPAFNELLFLGELVQLAKRGKSRQKYDLIVYDGFASGHFLSLLRTPAGIAESGIGGRVGEEALKIQNYIQDPQKVSIVMAGLMQPLVMLESMEFAKKLTQVVKPEQLTIALRRPLSFYCKKVHPNPDFETLLQGIKMQAAESEALFTKANSGLNIVWAEDYGGVQPENIAQVYQEIFSVFGAKP